MKTTAPTPRAAGTLFAGCLAFGILSILATSTGCARSGAWPGLAGAATVAQNDLNRTFAVSPGGKLILDADRGSIEITTGGDDTVQVDVLRKVTRGSEKKALQLLEAHEVTFDQDGGTVIIRARLDNPGSSWRSWGSGLQVRYLVTLPRTFDLDLKTAGGSITVPDLTGTVVAGTSGGSIKLAAIDGPVTCRTSGGSISVVSATQPIEARTSGGSINIGMANDAAKLNTSGGSIRIQVAHGPVDAGTSGGNIEIAEAHASVEATTSGGSVTASLASEFAGDCRLSTSGGNVRVHVPEGIDANLDARTSGGRVKCELPVLVQGEIKGNELVGKLGEGGRLIRLRTSGGSIHLNKT